MNEINLTSSQVQSLYAPGNWFMFSKNLLNYMNLEEATLFSYLMNVKPDEGGWVLIPVKGIENALKLNENKQRRLLQHLTTIGILEIEKRGMPARRCAKVNFNLIHQQDKHKKETKPRETPKQVTLGQVGAKGKTPSNFDVKAATYFIEKILKGNGRLKAASVKKYSETFRLLREHDMRHFEKDAESIIKEVLGFYRKRFNDEYIPRAVSAEAFRKKFEKIHDYMARHENKRENESESEYIIEE